MLCISLWQPWASLWATGAKIHETRHWAVPAKIGGRPVLGATIAIHAAKKLVKAASLDSACRDICAALFGGAWEKKLPRGAIVGTGRLIACWSTASRRGAVSANEQALGDWSDGRWAWQLAGAAPLVTPLPYTGQQGWFDVPEELLRAPPPSGVAQGLLL